MKNFIKAMVGMIIAAVAIICFFGCDSNEDSSDIYVETIPVMTTITVKSDTSTTTSTTTSTDTTTISTSTTETTSSTSTTTAIETTTTEFETTNTTVELVDAELTAPAPEDVDFTTYTEAVPVEPTITEEVIDTTPVYEQTEIVCVNQLTYYSGSYGCKGRWGRTLINNYSCASNYFDDGTIIHIESDDGSINGDYRVDDTGGMSNNVVDIFFSDYSNVPYPFSRDGRISCRVWIVE
jgi:uncharacterized lipoprotein YehR (DUF1307 family)